MPVEGRHPTAEDNCLARESLDGNSKLTPREWKAEHLNTRARARREASGGSEFYTVLLGQLRQTWPWGDFVDTPK